jgi:hypothetical protein
MRRKRFALLIIFLCLFTTNISHASPLSGSVQEDSFLQGKSNKVVDSATGMPVSGAMVSIPAKGLSASTDNFGNFKLDTQINDPAILSVQKSGYRPFSMTINNNTFNKPFILSIDKQSANQLVIDSELRHLGDDSYSSNSANAADFKTESSGPSFSKDFFIKDTKSNQQASITIGSVIGLDTEMARRLKQNKIMFAYSSPTYVFLNGQKVGEIKVNGDNQTISFPAEILKPNANNKVKIKTGKNLTQLNYTDYDDMEIMNVLLELN